MNFIEDDHELDAANIDAAGSKILSAEIFDNEDVPSRDNFIRSKHMSAVDDDEQYEYGEVETHAIDADTSDFSPHQFIAPATYAAPLSAAPAPVAYSAPATTYAAPAPATYAVPQQVEHIQQTQVRVEELEEKLSRMEENLKVRVHESTLMATTTGNSV